MVPFPLTEAIRRAISISYARPLAISISYMRGPRNMPMLAALSLRRVGGMVGALQVNLDQMGSAPIR